MNLKNIVWKDIFKPRYAVVFRVGHHPTINVEDGDFQLGRRYYAAVFDRPYKRPLDMPFNVFYGKLSSGGNVVAGHYWVLRMLYGIGSCLKHNMNSPILMKMEDRPTRPTESFPTPVRS